MDRSTAGKFGIAAFATLAILGAWLGIQIPEASHSSTSPTRWQSESHVGAQESRRADPIDDVTPGDHAVAGKELTQKVEWLARPGEPVLESHQPGAKGYSWATGIDPTGIEFPISDSIKRACEKLAKLQHGNCHDHTAVLARLAKEGRDEAWATSVEDAIASQVLAKPNFLIRSLDCRLTVCAVEIESTSGVFDRTAPDKLKTILSRVDTITGYERNSSNQLVTVTSITFARK